MHTMSYVFLSVNVKRAEGAVWGFLEKDVGTWRGWEAGESSKLRKTPKQVTVEVDQNTNSFYVRALQESPGKQAACPSPGLKSPFAIGVSRSNSNEKY